MNSDEAPHAQTEPQNDKVDRIALQYAGEYEWADGATIRLYFRLEEVSAALSEAASRVHGAILPGARGWLVAILRALYMSPHQSLSHAEISNETRVPAANVTYQVDVLEKDGYVVRVPHPTDRRITLVELTPEGEALCKKLLPARARFITELGKDFTDAEKATFNRLLDRLQVRAEKFRALE
jgi:DNA-binding MarR family transcriptional regulator